MVVQERIIQGQLSGGQNPRGAIVLGEFHWRQLSGGQLPRGKLFEGNCLGGKSLGVFVLGGIIRGAVIQLSEFYEIFPKHI